MENLTPKLNEQQIKQNVDALLKQGASKQIVQSYVNNYTRSQDGSFVLKTKQDNVGYSDTGADLKQTVEGIVGAVKERGADIKESVGAYIAGEQTLGETIRQSAVSAIRTPFDVAGEVIKGGIKTALPQEAETGIKQGVGAAVSKGIEVASDLVGKYEKLKQEKPLVAGVLNTALGLAPEAALTAKDMIEGYQKLQKTNPRAARNVDALLGIGETILDIATLGEAKVATTAGKEALEQGIKTGAKAAVEQGTKAVSKVKGATKVVTEPVVSAVSDTLAPGKIMQRVARIPKGEQAKFQKLTGESVGDYLVARNIFGNEEEIATKLYETFTNSKKTADDALATLDGTYKPKQVGTALSELAKREASVSTPGALSKDAKRIVQLSGKYKTDGLSMSEINEVKRLYERNVRVDYLKSAANKPENVARATNIDDAIRSWQLNQAEKLGLTNLSTINKETQAAKSLLDSLGKEIAGSAGNNALGLTDAVLVSGGDPTAIGMLLTKKILSLKGVQSSIAKRLSKNLPKKAPIKAKFGKAKGDLEDFLRNQELKAK